jgi:Putative adhesin
VRRAASILVLFVVLAFPAGAAEATRTLRAELRPAPGQAFAIENLAGAMRVVAGSGESVEAIATVHAESEELAGALRLEQVTDEKGRPALRVRYPLDRYRRYRYPGAPGGGRRHGFGRWFDGGHTTTKYDGYERVAVSSDDGVLAYADVEVRVPRRTIEAVFRQAVGPLEGSGVDGRIRFDTGSGDVVLHDSRGDLVADTGSGDVKAQSLEGRFTCDTGSGRCEVVSFRGERLRCDTGSGEVEVRGASAGRIELDTGSGDVRIVDSEADEIDADTGSGSLEVEADGKRLTRLKADTGSGDVRLRLGPDASFEAVADMGSGEIVSRYPDAQPILRKREVVGYRRGSAQTRISVDTGSGDLILEPGR